MGTINGCGMMYWGWRQIREDGTSTATRWVTLFWLPVLPVNRWQLKLVSVNATAGTDVVGRLQASEHVEYQIERGLALSGREIAVTLARAYLLLPLSLLAPLGFIAANLTWLQHTSISAGLLGAAFGIGIGASFVHFLWQCLMAIRRSQGPGRWGPHGGYVPRGLRSLTPAQ